MSGKLHVYVNLFFLFARLTSFEVLGASPEQTPTALSSHSSQSSLSDRANLNLNEVPSVDHDINHGVGRPMNIVVESTEHTLPTPRQQNVEDASKKERNLAMRRKNAKKRYAALPPHAKELRSRQNAEKQKARFESWTEQQKEDFRLRQNEAKKKHILNPTPRKYERFKKGKGTSIATAHHQQSAPIAHIPDLNEPPPTEARAQMAKQTGGTEKRKQSERADLTESTEATKRKKTSTQYTRMTSDQKLARSRQIGQAHRARFESWTEQQREEFRAKQKEAKKRHMERPTTRTYQRRTKGKYDLINEEDAQPPVQGYATLNLNEPPPAEPATTPASQLSKKRKQAAAGIGQNEAMQKKTITFYQRLTPEGRKERNHHVFIQQKERFESWTEAKKKEFRERKRANQRKYRINKKQKTQEQ